VPSTPLPFVPAAFVAAAVLGLPGEVAGQACAHGRVTQVFVDNHSVFDLDALGENVPFRWVYGAANKVHMDTNTGFIRDEILVEEGECLDPLLLAESERILRNHEFIAQADIYPVPQPDGTQHVVVETWDEWTTKFDVNMSVDRGFQFEGVNAREENFMGRGLFVGFLLRERREERDIGAVLATPRLFSTRLNAELSAGSTRTGNFVTQGFTYPFVGEVGRNAGQQFFGRRDELFPFTLTGDSLLSYILVPFEEETTELTFVRRFGEPGDLRVLGLSLFRESQNFGSFPRDLEFAVGGDFSRIEPEDTARVAGRLTDQIASTAIFRLNAILGHRAIRFIQRRRLDALDNVQDVPVGTDVNLTVGPTVADLSGSDEHAPTDLFTRLRVFQGWAPGPWIVSANFSGEVRRVFSDDVSGSGWRDALGEVDVYTYLRPEAFPAHTLFSRISMAGGWSVVRPFQLTLGGRTDVRGLSDGEIAGGRRMVLTLEDRITVDSPAPGLFGLGLTAFADAGRIWSGDVPFGTDSDWVVSVGGGLRFAFPRTSRNVTRVDLAFPVRGNGGIGSPVFRVTTLELIGLIRGFGDEEMVRSRRSRFGLDLIPEGRR